MTPDIDSLARAAAEEICDYYDLNKTRPYIHSAQGGCTLVSIIARACTAAVKEAALAGAWRPIATAPKDGTRVFSHHPERGYDVSFWFDDLECWASDVSGWKRDSGPTHWQPLPPPPAKEST